MLSRLTAMVFILSMVLCSCLLPRCASGLKVLPCTQWWPNASSAVRRASAST
jgi:hypothetical protein